VFRNLNQDISSAVDATLARLPAADRPVVTRP
jgi:hypothetical protein